MGGLSVDDFVGMHYAQSIAIQIARALMSFAPSSKVPLALA
jgi:hypothetical protein